MPELSVTPTGMPASEQGPTALICVDVQRDFLPGGALAVTHGDEVIGALISAMSHADLVVLSADHHPADHTSFKQAGGPWPTHCVAGTPGAEIDARLRIAAPQALVVHKGIASDVEAYSAFDGTDSEGRTLAEALRKHGINRLLVGGLATDYCVRATVLDGLRAHFRTAVLTAAVRGVNLRAGDSDRALQEMSAAGAQIV